MCKKLKVMIMTIGMLMSSCLSLIAQGLTTFVADSYVGTLGITIDGEHYDHNNIRMNVEKCADGKLNFSVEDFKLVRGGEVKPIGNITLTGVMLEKKNDTFLVGVSSSQKITIANGYMFSGMGVDEGKVDDVIGGGSSSEVIPSEDDKDSKEDTPEVKNEPEEKDGLNTIEGEGQEAEGEWGDEDSGAGSGSSGMGSESGDSGSGSGDSDNSDIEQKEPEWYGPVYGVMSVDVEGVVFKEYAELAFDVYIASLNKTLRVTFRSGNVPTRIVVVKTGSKKTSRGYTLSGIPVSASYRGVVVGN